MANPHPWLSSDQQAVVDAVHRPGNIIVTGPPGSGKSALLPYLYREIIAGGVSPRSVAIITFTRYAAEHVHGMIAASSAPLPGYIGTTTSWAWNIVSALDPKARILSEMDLEAARKWYKQVTGHLGHDFGRYLVQRHYIPIQIIISEAHRMLIRERRKRVLEDFSFANKIVIWDEFQDSSRAEFRLLKTLKPDRVILVGDPNQGIYSFRDADPAVISWARKEFDAQVYRLGIQHREYHIRTRRIDGRDLLADVLEAVHRNSMLKIGILARYNKTIDRVYNQLSNLIEVSRISTQHDPFSKPPWPEIYRNVRLAITPIAQRQPWMLDGTTIPDDIYQDPNTGLEESGLFAHVESSYLPIGILRLEDFVRWYPNRSVKDQLTDIRVAGEHRQWQSKVQVMTIHASKGLEFDIVYLLGVPDDVATWLESGNFEDIQVERMRVWYVGFTRAKIERVLVGGREWMY